MGGKEGSRGYLYQGIVAVLEALGQDDWDQIYIEFPTEGDKVDIALKYKDQITKAMQVKSIDSSFSKGNVSAWLSDIIKDYPCQYYKLILVGNCGPSAVNFIKAINKFQADCLDATSKQDLQSFNIGLLNGIEVFAKILPFDSADLKCLVREALWRYTYEAGHSLNPPQAALIADAMIEDQLLQSTNGGYVNRTDFNQELEDRIKLLLKRHSRMRKEISILSFSRGVEESSEGEAIVLNLKDKFDNRFLKPDLDWNVDIGKPVQEFLKANTSPQQAYQILMETHSSIAFTVGRVFDTKSGVDICPIQKTRAGKEMWEINPLDQTEYPTWNVEHLEWCNDAFDSVLILNVSRSIYSDVERYLIEQGTSVQRIINCTLKGVGGTNFAIQNGTHAAKLANIIHDVLSERSTVERRACVHIFTSAPNAFMFYLGQISRPFGNCILYEYDLEQRDSCSYIPAIHFGGKGGLE